MSKRYLPIIFFYGGTQTTKIYKLNYFYSNYLITDEITVLNLFVTLTTLGKILFYLVCFVLSKLKKTTCCLAKPENVLCDRKKKKMSLLSLDGNYIYHNTLLYILLQSFSSHAKVIQATESVPRACGHTGSLLLQWSIISDGENVSVTSEHASTQDQNPQL